MRLKRQLKGDVNVNLSGHLYNLGELADLLGSLIKIAKRENLEARVGNELLGLGEVGSLESGNNGNVEVHVLSNSNQTLGNVVTSDNTTENVDEDSSDTGLGSDELEGLLDGVGSGSSTTVEEVGGLTSVQLDDIHGGHSETSSVDKTANVSVELDEVKTVLGSLNLLGVLLGQISPGPDLLLSERGVVVEAELGVHGNHSVVGGLRQRVNLDLGGVLVGEDLVELLDVVSSLLGGLGGETEGLGDLNGLGVGDTGVDVNGEGVDGIGVLGGNTLNVHTSLGRSDNDRLLGGSVHEDGNVGLSSHKLSLHNVDGSHRLTLGTGLLGEDLVVEHLLGVHLGLGGGGDELDTALEAVVEVALTSATGQSLSLDDHILASKLLGNILSLLGGSGGASLGDIDTVVLEDLGGSELVEREVSSLSLGDLWLVRLISFLDNGEIRSVKGRLKRTPVDGVNCHFDENGIALVLVLPMLIIPLHARISYYVHACAFSRGVFPDDNEQAVGDNKTNVARCFATQLPMIHRCTLPVCRSQDPSVVSERLDMCNHKRRKTRTGKTGQLSAETDTGRSHCGGLWRQILT